MQNNERISEASALLGAAMIFSSFGLLIRLIADMFSDYASVAARAAGSVFVITTLI